MEEKPFDEPRLALNRIYTRGGDRGQTSLAGGQRIAKNAPRIECYGTVDELLASLGVACLTAEEALALHPRLAVLATIIHRVQHELFNLGSMLATLPEDIHPRQARVTGAEVAQIEREIDAMNEELPALRSFVLPGGSRLCAELHVARTICRRAERLAVGMELSGEVLPPDAIRYLNRLSDALFVWSRWANLQLGTPEVLWDPNQAASAKDRG